MHTFRIVGSLAILAAIAGVSGYLILTRFIPVLSLQELLTAIGLLAVAGSLLLVGVLAAMQRRTPEEENAATSELVTEYQDTLIERYMSTQ